MSSEEAELLKLLDSYQKSIKTNKAKFWKPIPKQLDFLNCKRRRKGLISGNRCGKSDTMLFETACHLTGIYPDYWQGTKFKKPIDCWVVGISFEKLVGTVQKKLFGGMPGTGTWGEGFIPLDCLDRKPIMKPGMSGVIGSVQVKCAYGGYSNVTFWSRSQAREEFQGDEVHLIAYDEEPPADIHAECSMRLAVPMSRGEGLALYAFTPLEGETEVWKGLVQNPNAEFFSICMDEVPWLTEDVIEDILRDCPTEMEKRARRYGIPGVGSDQIFKFEEHQYTCDSFEIPKHWPRIGGLDIGKNHPTGAVSIAWDRESDSIYAYNEFKKSATDAYEIARTLRHWNLAFATSHDAFNDTLAGNVSTLFRQEGLEVFSAGRDLWARIEKARKMIGTGRLWIFKDRCPELIKEIRVYHTKENGHTVADKYDDMVSAWLHAVQFYEKASCRIYRNEYAESAPKWEPSSDGYF